MWKHTGSNRGPSACKADALNQLSYASVLLLRTSPHSLRECEDKSIFFFSKIFFDFFIRGTVMAQVIFMQPQILSLHP